MNDNLIFIASEISWQEVALFAILQISVIFYLVKRDG